MTDCMNTEKEINISWLFCVPPPPTKHIVALLSLQTIKPDICHKLWDSGDLDYWYNAYTKMIIYDFALGAI